MGQDPASETTEEKARFNEIRFDELLRILWVRKYLIALTIAAFLGFGYFLSLVLPKTYEAVATVYPVTSSSSSNLSDYAGLASLAGISLPSSGGGSSPAKTLNALMSSRILIERLVVEMNLVERLKIPGATAEAKLQNAVGAFRGALKSKEDARTGVISISFQLKDAALAQELTNTVIDVLEKLLLDKSLTSRQKKAQQLTRQIEDQGRKVADFQRQLAQFQRDTTMLNPQAQAGRVVDAYTGMIQQRMDLELQLATAQASYSPDNPQITLLKTKILNLESQISRVKNEVDGDMPSLKLAPDNLIKFQNLSRDLEIATKIYATLLATMEQLKLETDDEQVFIEVLDRALLPTDGKPSSTLVIVAMGALGAFVSLVLVGALEIFLVNRRRRAQAIDAVPGSPN